MAERKHLPSYTALAVALAAAALAIGVSSAEAGKRHRDYAYADSYGNLIIYSRAGYKRIVVGKGFLAAELNAYSGAAGEEPNVVRLEGGYDPGVDCYRPPVVVRGRSYMYGLADGELPEPAGSCRNR